MCYHLSQKEKGDNISLPNQNPYPQIYRQFPPIHTHTYTHSCTHIRSFPSCFPSSVSLFLSPQLGLFTTTSSRLKLHSYSAPGTPAAMQQSKRNVILYHLHPWERGNREGRRVEGKRRERER